MKVPPGALSPPLLHVIMTRGCMTYVSVITRGGHGSGVPEDSAFFFGSRSRGQKFVKNHTRSHF